MRPIVRYCYFLTLGVFLSIHSSSTAELQTTNIHPFYSLVEELSEEIFFIDPADQNNITKLITRLGDWGVGKLLWHIKEMNHLGDQIRHVHPLCFLSYIYSQPHLVTSMKSINSNYFKKKEFISGLSEKMEFEADRNNLLPYVKNFSQKVGCEYWEEIAIFLDRRDWAGLLTYLNELQLGKAR